MSYVVSNQQTSLKEMIDPDMGPMCMSLANVYIANDERPQIWNSNCIGIEASSIS